MCILIYIVDHKITIAKLLLKILLSYFSYQYIFISKILIKIGSIKKFLVPNSNIITPQPVTEIQKREGHCTENWNIVHRKCLNTAQSEKFDSALPAASDITLLISF